MASTPTQPPKPQQPQHQPPKPHQPEPPHKPEPPKQPPHHDADKDKHHDKHDDAADKHRDPNRADPPPPNQPQQHRPAAETPVAGVGPPEPGLPIGARPKDDRDPQAAKFEAHAAPPRWDEPNEVKAPPAFTPTPALDPRAQKPPEGVYADGMPIADEQRARAAYVETHGVEAYAREADQRPDADKPRIDKNALAGGAAYVSAGTQRQVPGVTPPTKRE